MSEMYGLDNEEQVFFYEQDFYVLSNFSAFKLRWRRRDFDTSEHAYHWEKFDGSASHQPEIQRLILEARSAHEAFKIAEKYRASRRTDWDDIKVQIMGNILRAKAHQHDYVQRKLLATGERELIENSWRDDFWGWGPNRDGKNMLGKLWMEVRAELRESGTGYLQNAGKMSERLSAHEREILEILEILETLDVHGGFTTRHIAKQAHQYISSMRSALTGLKKRGLVDYPDDQKPVCWKLTEAGALTLRTGHQQSEEG